MKKIQKQNLIIAVIYPIVFPILLIHQILPIKIISKAL